MRHPSKSAVLGSGAAVATLSVLSATATPAHAWHNFGAPYIESMYCGDYFGTKHWGIRVSDDYAIQEVSLDHNCPITDGRNLRVRIKYRTEGGAGPVRYLSGQWSNVPMNRANRKIMPSGSQIHWVCAGIRQYNGIWNIRQAGRDYAHTVDDCNMNIWSDSPDAPW
jgi:hypothetical protein